MHAKFDTQHLIMTIFFWWQDFSISYVPDFRGPVIPSEELTYRDLREIVTVTGFQVSRLTGLLVSSQTRQRSQN